VRNRHVLLSCVMSCSLAVSFVVDDDDEEEDKMMRFASAGRIPVFFMNENV
jgi:hypothetical protein